MENGGQSESVIRARGLRRYFRDVKAVDGVDLDIVRGECFGLLGPNGAGKTTSVEILEGLQVPDEGEIEILGQGWCQRSDCTLKRRIGVQLQETRFNEKLTVKEIVRLFRSFYPRGRGIGELLDMLGLQDKAAALVGKLSGGQKQRLALACALAGEPELLFLDEPTTGLDPQVRRHIWTIVEEFKASGGTVVLTTHYMDEAARLCDRVAIMDHGRIRAVGTPVGLITDLDADLIVDITLSRPVTDDFWLAIPAIRLLADRGDQRWRLTVSDMASGLPALVGRLQEDGIGLLNLTTHQASLEDVFISLTGRGLRDE